MFDFHEKRKIKRFLYSKIVILGLFLLAILMSGTVYDRYVVAKEMEGKLIAKRTELEELQLRAEALKSKVEYLENERGIEEELRNRFDVAREGEQVIVLIDQKKTEHKTSSTSDAASVENSQPKKSFFSFLKFWD